MDSLLSAAFENQLLAVMAVVAFFLLIVVTAGVVYLTAIEWRDKRKRGNEARVMPSRGAGVSKRK